MALAKSRLHCFIGACDGIAAVEFGVLSPVIFAVLILMLDFSYGYFIKLRVIAAASAAGEYVFQNGASVSASSLATFVSNVQTVVQKSANLSTAPVVAVYYNNVLDSSNLDNYYCVSGYAPVVWSSTGTTISSCGNSVMSGKFVTVVVNASGSTIFQPDPILSHTVNLSETVIVRIE